MEKWKSGKVESGKVESEKSRKWKVQDHGSSKSGKVEKFKMEKFNSDSKPGICVSAIWTNHNLQPFSYRATVIIINRLNFRIMAHIDADNISMAAAVEATTEMMLRNVSSHVCVGPMPAGAINILNLPIREILASISYDYILFSFNRKSINNN